MKQPDDHPWKERLLPERYSHPCGEGCKCRRHTESYRFTSEDRPQGRQFTSEYQPIKGEVPVENLQRAFKKSGLTKCELARRLGWTKVVPNVHRVSETLGLQIQTSGKKRRRVTYETALRLARAMNADLQEVGV